MPKANILEAQQFAVSRKGRGHKIKQSSLTIPTTYYLGRINKFYCSTYVDKAVHCKTSILMEVLVQNSSFHYVEVLGLCNIDFVALFLLRMSMCILPILSIQYNHHQLERKFRLEIFETTSSESNIMVFKSLHGLALQYMCNLFTNTSSLTSRNLRNSATDLRIPKKKSTNGQKCFSFQNNTPKSHVYL